MTHRLQGRTEAGAWAQGTTFVRGAQATYPYTAVWNELSEGVGAPAQWTFDSDAQGWVDNPLQGGVPLEWSASDGRVIGTLSTLPSFFNGYSYAYSPYFKLLGRGPFKLRATVAAGIVTGHVEASDLKTMSVELRQSGWMSDSVLATAEDTTLTGAWITLETGLWTPPPELDLNTASLNIACEISYGTSLFPPYGDATWRIHVNDATVLHADGSIAQKLITPAKLGRVWDGSQWVTFV